MANFGFIIDNRRCIGCHACTVACKSEHQVPVGVNRTWVKYIEKGEFPQSQRLFSVMRCNHCDAAPCTEICPVTALYRRSDGIVDFDNRRCIGCKACMQACPYDALYIDPQTHTAAKCNYCAHRIDVGLEPACVNVCPTQAIVSGDLDDPQSRISQLKQEQQVTARKVEKGTQPALFYVDADPASLQPLAAGANDEFMWSGQQRGVGHFAHDAGSAPEHALDTLSRLLSFGEESTKLAEQVSHEKAQEVLRSMAGQPRRAYDAPQKGILWGWQVSGYLWTKSIAAGVVIVAMLAKLILGAGIAWNLEVGSILTSLIFLGLTGGLLVWDLDQPKRFLYVLLRPQWRSWLVRGAYIITVFSGLLVLNLALSYLADGHILHRVLPIPLLVGAVLTAMYTAFLFAQAKGRDYWQSSLAPWHMVTHAVVAGAALLGMFASFWDPTFVSFLRVVLGLATVIHIVGTLAEFVLPHSSAETSKVIAMIRSGRYSRLFWTVTIGAGSVLPLILLLVSPVAALPLISLLLLAGIFAAQHIWVRAPQQIPLS